MAGAAADRAELPTIELDEIRETSATRFGRPQDFGELICLPVYTDRLVAGEAVSVLVARLIFPKAAYWQAVLTLPEVLPLDAYGLGPAPRRGVN